MRTPQELREIAGELFVEDGWPTAKLVIAAGALREYADALERAQAGITDKVVEEAQLAAYQYDSDALIVPNAMRAALESVWPLQSKEPQP